MFSDVFLDIAPAHVWWFILLNYNSTCSMIFLPDFTSTRLVIFSSKFHQHTFGVFCLQILPAHVWWFMLLNFKSTCLVIFLIVDITERIPKKKEAPFHFDLIWAFLCCVFGSIQIVLDSSFTIVGSPFWESCLVPLWVPIGCVLLPFFGCHFWVPFTVRPSLSSDTLLFFFVSMGPRRS